MRPFFATISAALLTAVVSATSTVPRNLDSSAIPKTSLCQQGQSYFLAENCYQLSGHDTGIWARWNASQAELGWDYLEVGGDLKYWNGQDEANFSRENNMQAFGVIEGMITAERISYMVGSQNEPPLRADVAAWIEKHIAYMQAMAAKNRVGPGARYKGQDFWGHVGNILAQMEGIAQGYNAVKPVSGANVTLYDIFLLNGNFADEIGDVVIALNKGYGKYKKDELLAPRRIGSHCSALIKPTGDDLFVSHDTWSGFTQMAHRIYKKYNVFGRVVVFSAYPAAVASGDDWYQITNDKSNAQARAVSMTVQETTNEVFNTSLYTAVVPTTVSEFIRVMAANYLATNGEEWTRAFSMENSGTYNNQWQIVDFRRYVPGSSIAPGTLWIAEQIPGKIVRADMSFKLDADKNQGYWASYNVPYFQEIFDLSGYKQMVAEQGSFWSYTKYARPEIFARNETDVKDIASMMRMMRYNNYQVDPFSIIPNCKGAGPSCATTHSSMLSISSRGDLMKEYPTKAEMIENYGPLYSFVAQGCFGAIDSKIASWKNRDSLNSWAISGPTNDQVPTFKWGVSPSCPESQRPAGSPVTFDFPWVAFQNNVPLN